MLVDLHSQSWFRSITAFESALPRSAFTAELCSKPYPFDTCAQMEKTTDPERFIRRKDGLELYKS